MTTNTTDYNTKLAQSDAKLVKLASTSEGRYALSILLDDMRLRFHLDAPPLTFHPVTKEFNLEDTIRRGSFFEVHNIYAAFVEGETIGQYKDIQ